MTPDERFDSRVCRTESCWLWQGTVNGSGYGCISINKRVWLAHRYAYARAFGPLPVGLCVCHQCDTRLCVRPDHLFLGTYKDNMVDMRQKGRAYQVAEIRRQYQTGGYTYEDLAAQFEVARSTVGMIVTGHLWRTVA